MMDSVTFQTMLRPQGFWQHFPNALRVCGGEVRVAFLYTKREMHELDADFHYARSSLLRYANWMLIHVAPYLESYDKLEYPNDTWVAQDTRKAALLHAAYRYSLDNREAFLAKAIYFRNYIVDTLETSDTLHYTCIQAILLQNHGPLGSVWTEQPAYTYDSISVPGIQETSTAWSHTRGCAVAWWRCLCMLSVTREAASLRHRFPQAAREVHNW